MFTQTIETNSSFWKFDLDRMVYLRLPKNEIPVHPFASIGAKPYEGHEVAFNAIKLGHLDSDGTQQFFVFNTGKKFGEGAITQSWAVSDQDLTWISTYLNLGIH